MIKRQRKPKGTPAAPPTDPATTPGTEQQEAFDQYAQQCAAADSLNLKKLEEGAANVEDAPPQETMDAPASQNHAPQSCADTTVGAPLESEQNRAQSGEKAREETQSEPIGPPAPKVAAKAATTVKTEPTESYLDKTIRVLEKMGYTYEECANVLSGFDTNAQVDLWAVIDQINDARRTAAEMPLKPADNGTSSQEHEEGSEWTSWKKILGSPSPIGTNGVGKVGPDGAITTGRLRGSPTTVTLCIRRLINIFRLQWKGQTHKNLTRVSPAIIHLLILEWRTRSR